MTAKTPHISNDSIEQESIRATAATLESFVRGNFNLREDDPYFGRDINLWEEGYVDSTGVVEVIAFLEQTFQVAIPEQVLFSPDFTSINGMARAIQSLARKTASIS